jgi:prepilin-type N-terminal cleavage/methylation domain-containing protein
MKKGFTLIEMLIVLGVLAVLLGIGVFNFIKFRKTLELRQAQQVFVQELNRARSDARKLSQDQKITWTAHQLTIGARVISLGDIELLKLSGSNELIYTAPYGRLKATDYHFELRHGELKSQVRVYGVTGKIKVVGI